MRIIIIIINDNNNNSHSFISFILCLEKVGGV